MTKADKPVKRETLTNIRDRGVYRPLIIEVHATYVKLRQKGLRRVFTVTYDQIYTLGARNAAEQQRRDHIDAMKLKYGSKYRGQKR